MVISLWSKTVLNRPSNPRQESTAIYTLTDEEVKLLKDKIHEKKSDSVLLIREGDIKSLENTWYEVIVIKDGVHYSVLRESLYDRAQKEFIRYMKTLSPLLSSGIAPLGSYVEAFSQFVEKAMDLEESHPEWTPAHLVARMGYSLPFRKKIKEFVDNLNTQPGTSKDTVLTQAILSHEFAVVDAVLALNPNLMAQDANGLTAFHVACGSTNQQLFLRVLKEYVDRDEQIDYLIMNKATDPPTGTSTEKASSFNFMRIRSNQHGRYTPLHVACIRDTPSNITDLLKLRLPIDVLLAEGQMSRQAAKERRANLKMWRETRIPFDPPILQDIDWEEVKRGGSPLHWVTSKKSMIHLLEYNFPLNTPNLEGETPLHVIIRKFAKNPSANLHLTLLLLSFGASTNVLDIRGLSPLHTAIKTGQSLSLLEAIVSFDTDVNQVTSRGESPRHLTQEVADRGKGEITLWILHSVGGERCPTRLPGCFDGCVPGGGMNGSPFVRWPPLTGESLYTPYMKSLIQGALNDKRYGKGVSNLLCLDGGGVKGILSCIMLIELQKRLSRPIKEYFNWFSGTSTGSFIAASLVKAIHPKQILKMYIHMKDTIMSGQDKEASNLEKTLKQILGANPITDIKDVKLLIPGTLADRKPAQLHLFRSYPNPDSLVGLIDTSTEILNRVENTDEKFLWFACRASGAAPTYFNPAGSVIDGGIIAANPTIDTLTEFGKWNAAMDFTNKPELKENIGIVVSIGTGKWPIVKTDIVNYQKPSWAAPIQSLTHLRGLTEMLALVATQTDSYVFDRIQAMCLSLGAPFFRLNPPLSEQFELDIVDDETIANTMYETKAYMWAVKGDVKILCHLLEKTRKSEKKELRRKG